MANKTHAVKKIAATIAAESFYRRRGGHMPRGSKESYTRKQKRQASNIGDRAKKSQQHSAVI